MKTDITVSANITEKIIKKFFWTKDDIVDSNVLVTVVQNAFQYLSITSCTAYM